MGGMVLTTESFIIENRCRAAVMGSAEGRRHIAFFSAIPDDLIPWMVPFW
jgi:hypothetical protein